MTTAKICGCHISRSLKTTRKYNLAVAESVLQRFVGVSARCLKDKVIFVCCRFLTSTIIVVHYDLFRSR